MDTYIAAVVAASRRAIDLVLALPPVAILALAVVAATLATFLAVRPYAMGAASRFVVYVVVLGGSLAAGTTLVHMHWDKAERVVRGLIDDTQPRRTGVVDRLDASTRDAAEGRR